MKKKSVLMHLTDNTKTIPTNSLKIVVGDSKIGREEIHRSIVEKTPNETKTG